jgi:hypothetical protein
VLVPDVVLVVVVLSPPPPQATKVKLHSAAMATSSGRVSVWWRAMFFVVGM